MRRFDLLGLFPALVAIVLTAAAAQARAADVAVNVKIDATDDQEIAWFPESADLDLALRPPVQLAAAPTTPLQDTPAEQALIPLPPAAWTGLAGLAILTIPNCRRMLHRIVR